MQTKKKQTNKQAHKQTNKQAHKQTNKHTVSKYWQVTLCCK